MSRGIEGNALMERSGGSWSKHHAQALKDEKACWNEASRTLSDLNPDLKFYGVVGGMHEASPWNELSAMALRGANPCPTPTFYKEAE